MNDLVQLRGSFKSRKNPSTPKGPRLADGVVITSAMIAETIAQLRAALLFFTKDTRLGGAMVNVHYHLIVPKSDRVQAILSRGNNPSDFIRGSRFEKFTRRDGKETLAHVFTHHVPIDALRRSIELLENVGHIIENEFAGQIDCGKAKQTWGRVQEKKHPHFRTRFFAALHDLAVVREIGVAHWQVLSDQTALVALYRTGVEPRTLLARYGIDVQPDAVLDEVTVQLDVKQLHRLNSEAPYLISMGVRDICQMPIESVGDLKDPLAFPAIPAPGNEPTVGVIDTLFDETAYFHEWVTTERRLPADIPDDPRDTMHGTEVCSIVVDGPALNPELDDGCGRFRVRHFGVATAGRFSSLAIIRQIRQIVGENPDIHVWNLSLGSAMEISRDSISPQAAALDEIQRAHDVVFVVAGTNVPDDAMGREDMLLGAPADSLNAVVVNAVDMHGEPASYTRVGPVLSFFYKPDVCYYGGDGDENGTGMCVCNGFRKVYASGTSFAAPWIARKMAYLIDVMHVNKEIAKALLIDAAAGWKARAHNDMLRKGYGLVPKSIREIVSCNDEEIKFVLTATADKWETYNYRLPVPVVAGKHPYYVRATLVYFPSCDRNQGVDYTITEMDVYVGPVWDKDGKPRIRPIDDNMQSDDDATRGIWEEDARKMFRKWDNVKHVTETIKARSQPRKAGASGMWGVRVVTKDRRNDGSRDKLAFGLVVTLKEMNGENRFDDFVQACEQKGWIVVPITIGNQIDIFNQAESEIEME